MGLESVLTTINLLFYIELIWSNLSLGEVKSPTLMVFVFKWRYDCRLHTSNSKLC